MLTHLNISGCCRPFADSNYFSGSLKNIKSLDISRSFWQDVELINYPDMDVLRLSHSSVKKLSLQNLPKLKDIRTVGSSFEIMTLDGLEQITVLEMLHSNVGRLEVRNCPRLVEVSLFNSTVGAIHFNGNHELRSLNLSSATVNTLDLTDPKSFSKLDWIDVSYSIINNLVVRDLSSLSNFLVKGASIQMMVL